MSFENMWLDKRKVSGLTKTIVSENTIRIVNYNSVCQGVFACMCAFVVKLSNIT